MCSLHFKTLPHRINAECKATRITSKNIDINISLDVKITYFEANEIRIVSFIPGVAINWASCV